MQLLFLVGLAAYFAVVFQLSLTQLPKWAAPGVWQMFTLRDPTATLLVADARRGESWEAVDLPALFPTRWDSGYRFSRASFRRSPGRMEVLGASTCLRLPEPAEEVRFTEQRWRRVLGSNQRRRYTETVIHTHRCGSKVRLPGGRVLPDDGR